jgi:hypothetical protein
MEKILQRIKKFQIPLNLEHQTVNKIEIFFNGRNPNPCQLWGSTCPEYSGF